MADLQLAAMQKQLLKIANDFEQLREQFKTITESQAEERKARSEMREVVKQLDARLTALDADVNEIVEGLQELADTAEEGTEDSDESEDISQIDVPGFEVAESGDLIVDETKIEEWTLPQMIVVAHYLPTPLDLRPYEAQPREARRLLYEALEKYDVRPPRIAAPSMTPGRAPIPPDMAAMPATVPTGDDGLPVRSPIVGKPAFFHVPRNLWRVTPPFDSLHRTAERFRGAMVRSNAWHCKQFNCHDCVEQNKNLNRVVQCAVAEVRRGNEAFSFALTEDEKALCTEAVADMLVELDVAAQRPLGDTKAVV